MDRPGRFYHTAGRALGLALGLTLAWCSLNLPALASWLEVNAAVSPAPQTEAPLREAGMAAFVAQYPDLPVAVGLTKLAGDWALIHFRANPAGAAEGARGEVYLGLGRWDGVAWRVAVEGSADFAAWLDECPEELIPAGPIFLKQGF